LNDRLTREISRCGSIEAELLEREARLKEAQRVAHVGSWDYNITTDSLRWSDEMCRVFGVTQEDFGGSYEAFLDAIDEEDRERVDKAYTDSIRNRTPYDITYKLTGNNGQIKYVHAR
jgi:PAS domain-containing protein